MIEYLYAALNSPYGIIVEFDDPGRARYQLYEKRRKDPELECISITPSPTNEKQLWIVKRHAES